MSNYIRHRPRMIRESVFDNLKIVLEELKWIDPAGGDDYMGMLGDNPITLTDYFPVEAVYQGEDVEINTLAVDQGTQSEPQHIELGSDNREQMHMFNLAFFAKNDGIALSLFSDLTDHYKGVAPTGRWVDVESNHPYHVEVGKFESIPLWNFQESEPTPVVNMAVLSFEVAKSPEQPTPGRLLWFAQLVLLDTLYYDADE